jgi:hypothetical protein
MTQIRQLDDTEYPFVPEEFTWDPTSEDEAN